jgi:hypothetical protein
MNAVHVRMRLNVVRVFGTGLAFLFGSELFQAGMGVPIAGLDLPAILFRGKASHNLT